MRTFLSVLGLLVILSGPLFAGPERTTTADPVFTDTGNKFRLIAVPQSSQTVVLISSPPADSGLGIGTWRSRDIVNCSTNAALTILPDNTNYTSYSSTYGITLSSDTTGNGAGSRLTIRNQAAIWGIWTNGRSPGGAGACGWEEYWAK